MDPLTDEYLRAARLPSSSLGRLAALRCDERIEVSTTDDATWVTWDTHRPDVVAALMPAHGVVFFGRRDGQWFPFGSRLPDFDVPDLADGESLADVLTPAPFPVLRPQSLREPAIVIRLVPSDRPAKTAALRCSMAQLAKWVDVATTFTISSVSATRCGNVVIMRGERLPALVGERFWGDRVWCPLGFRPDPDWPEDALRAVADVSSHQLLLITPDGVDAIPDAAFRPLTRATVRRAVTP